MIDTESYVAELKASVEKNTSCISGELIEYAENLFEMTVVRIIENSFSYNIHIKNCDNENNLPLQMEVDKNIKKVKVGQTIKVKFEQNSVFDF